ncbi:plasmid replication protein RepC [Phaeovulum sp. W22_SRMD_FR3]|uniref:plasmid replication protein RepC n=1 Tax=Phaeovulum sp. W22_SRMD_FR3 TaxID=3240274 RepID=UPI003F9887A8
MAFIQAAASLGAQNKETLSADNAVPERHIVIATLRNAAHLMGLTAPVIATLDAMLSCLPPKRAHHTVFASNTTLTFRLNGVTDRTIRRHAALLQEAGLLIRRDSPNKKRFTRHNTHEGKSLRFGFDLSPLFQRLQEIAALAAEAMIERERIDYMRAKIRAVAHDILRTNPENNEAASALRILRRKLTLQDCESLMNTLVQSAVSATVQIEKTESDTTILTASDGQNVRHHHRSTKENTDKKAITPTQDNKTNLDTLTVAELLDACPEAAEFALKKIESVSDVVAHARTLAPMMGIDEKNYQAAQDHLGAFGAAATVWAVMQFHKKIHKVGAYYRALTSGNKSRDFDPLRLIRRLGQRNRTAI